MTEPTAIGKTIASPTPIEKSVAQQITPKPPIETSSLERVSLPRISIQFCTQCKWMLRAAYVRLSELYLLPPLNLRSSYWILICKLDKFAFSSAEIQILRKIYSDAY